MNKNKRENKKRKADKQNIKLKIKSLLKKTPKTKDPQKADRSCIQAIAKGDRKKVGALPRKRWGVLAIFVIR